MKRLLGVLAAIALAFVALPAHSQSATITLPFSFSAAGVTAPLALSGQTSCALQFTSVGTTGNFTVYGATSALPGYTTPVSSIGTGGTVTNPTITTYTGSIAGFIGLRISANSVVGTFAGNLVCGASIVGTQSTTVITNSTNSPIPVAIITGGGGGSGGNVVVTNSSASPIPIYGVGTATVQIVPGSPIPVTTPPPYVAPTCPAAPNAPCVQITGAVPVTGVPTPLPVATDSTSSTRVAAIGIGADTVFPVSPSTSGTSLGTPPTFAVGVEIDVPPGSCFSEYKATTQAANAAAAALVAHTWCDTFTTSATSFSFNLSGGQLIWITNVVAGTSSTYVSGLPTFAWL